MPSRRKSNRWTRTATRVTTPEGTSPTTMKNRILRVAAELGVPVTIRKVPGGLIFWRSTDEDLQQAQEIADTTPIRSAAAASSPVAVAVGAYNAAHQHTTVLQREAIR